MQRRCERQSRFHALTSYSKTCRGRSNPDSDAGCDHGLNDSTFTARVIDSTRSDIISAVTGAVGALKGPLHGGAPWPALDMVIEIGEADRAEAVIHAMLERGERLMGFGHRVYRVRDPRADVLTAAEQTINLCKGNTRYLPRRGVDKSTNTH